MTSSIAVDDPAHPSLPSYDEPFRAERSPFLWLFEREVLRFLSIWRYRDSFAVLRPSGRG